MRSATARRSASDVWPFRCPETFIATVSLIPLRTMLRTPDRGRSCTIGPGLPAGKHARRQGARNSPTRCPRGIPGVSEYALVDAPALPLEAIHLREMLAERDEQGRARACRARARGCRRAAETPVPVSTSRSRPCRDGVARRRSGPRPPRPARPPSIPRKRPGSAPRPGARASTPWSARWGQRAVATSLLIERARWPS